MKWDQLIRDNRDDIAHIVTFETGKPLAESQGELDYALGFTVSVFASLFVLGVWFEMEKC